MCYPTRHVELPSSVHHTVIRVILIGGLRPSGRADPLGSNPRYGLTHRDDRLDASIRYDAVVDAAVSLAGEMK
jgi:hypothetical protein